MTGARLALFVTVAVGAARVTAGQAVSPAERTAFVRITVPPYNDSDDSLAQVQKLIAVDTPRRSTVAPGDTLPSLILREYGFGASNLQQTYGLLENAIISHNPTKIRSRTDLKKGDVIDVPDLPKWMRFNPDIASNSIPSLGISRVVDAIGGPVAEPVRPVARLTAAAADVLVSVKESMIRRFEELGLIKRGAGADPYPTHSMVINLSADNCDQPAAPPVLSKSDVKDMQAIFNAAGKTHKAQLFVVDMGWPNEEAQKRSVAALRQLFQDVRRKFKLGAKDIGAIPWVEPGKDFAPQHPVKIDAALKEFRALDGKSLVEVVYVPLTRAQNADPILRELIELGFIVSTLRNGNADPAAAVYAVPKDVLDGAQRVVSETLPQVPLSATNDIVTTEKSIVTSLITLATESARDTGAFFHVSESWWVQENAQYFGELGKPGGLVVAAVGNRNKEIMADAVEFSKRSADNAAYLAVINQNIAGRRICNTNYIDDGFIPQSNVAGFVGDIDGETGSSFSAARIAWLLSAAEAMRDPLVAAANWHADLKRRLNLLRGAPGASVSLQSIRIDPVKLLKIWN